MSDDKSTKKSIEKISFEDALKTQIMINQALISILAEKQIITEDELRNKIKEIKINRTVDIDEPS
jgi:hypothetical protein